MSGDPIFKILQNAAFHEMGIAPLDMIIYDYSRVLSELPPDEARKMKRKFRKLWRKAAKKPGKGIAKTYTEQLGLGSKEPTRKQKRMRKVEVARRVAQTVTHAKHKLLSPEANDAP
jgi:hypothetical protein